MIDALFLMFSYLLGSIPCGLIVSKLLNSTDVRDCGSGNIGATNVFRVCGKIPGALTLMLDILKGYAGVVVVGLSSDSRLLMSLGVLFVILGHIYPIWLKFKGGKGVAAAIGAVMCYNPVLGVIMMICWVVTFLITRTSSTSSLVSFIIMVATSYYLSRDVYFSIVMIIVSILVIMRHRENINRILSNTEEKL